ncbi:glycosyltransferase family protein [Calothrix sp. PCC 6303]|uniref:glycosyltransferase family protein n=1 Tax=Calothrix sp. PCC 6303 TaxID=1170562 RepID=UPI0002A00B3D|nr:glycosyltransferase [Calothrix sp. PCC 6303]AFZ01138.1 Glycosyltransferase 28 domain protein [Calothrix sp. PCC 6303]
MKKLMFYCQHILGMGHLVRSMEIVRGLIPEFQVCFINGGEVIQEFPFPDGIEVINLPAIKTDSEFQSLQVVDTSFTLAEVQEIRKNKLLEIFNQFQPDIFMIELFPFGRGKFKFELIPLLEQAKASKKPVKVVSSLRDIVVTKSNRVDYEEKVCKLMNKYFDLLLIHGDPKFYPLAETFTRLADIRCQISYTGFVVQKPPINPILNSEEQAIIESDNPLILVSVGGGRFGHELIDCVVASAPILAQKIPHHIQVFTGPFISPEKLDNWQNLTANHENISVSCYTTNLLSYMQKADLSISMSGYNTTLNIMTIGVKAMILPFTGNDDQEQQMRAEKLEKLGVVKMIQPQELQPEIFADEIINYLRKDHNTINFDFNGVENTTSLLKQLIPQPQVV